MQDFFFALWWEIIHALELHYIKPPSSRLSYIETNRINPPFLIQALLSSIHQDTTFLATHSMMDYSLLVGLDSNNNNLFVGIIDYIRTFTWDKKLENLVKSSGILGGANKTPTVVSPKVYKNRFIDAMYRYFIVLPDINHREEEVSSTTNNKFTTVAGAARESSEASAFS